MVSLPERRGSSRRSGANLLSGEIRAGRELKGRLSVVMVSASRCCGRAAPGCNEFPLTEAEVCDEGEDRL